MQVTTSTAALEILATLTPLAEIDAALAEIDRDMRTAVTMIGAVLDGHNVRQKTAAGYVKVSRVKSLAGDNLYYEVSVPSLFEGVTVNAVHVAYGIIEVCDLLSISGANMWDHAEIMTAPKGAVTDLALDTDNLDCVTAFDPDDNSDLDDQLSEVVA